MEKPSFDEVVVAGKLRPSESTGLILAMTQSREHMTEVSSIVHAALERRRQAIVYELARRLYEGFLDHRAKLEAVAVNEERGWVKITSLSQLRTIVGGRFQNLKQKWTKAGFPLREHRGDRGGQIRVDSDGWIDLSVWISEQNFEVRLADENAPWLFEVRKLGEG